MKRYLIPPIMILAIVALAIAGLAMLLIEPALTLFDREECWRR